MYVYAYKAGSVSAKDLANSLGVSRIRHNNSRFVGRPTKTVINWGASSLPEQVLRCNVINSPDAVSLCSNKRSFFRHLEGKELNRPDSTEDRSVAEAWIISGKTVVCRTKLTGNSGEGIVIAETVEELVEAPLYTQYVKKSQEFRVHIMRGEVFLVQRKARSLDVPDDQVNWKVRNLAGGFIYARNEDTGSYPMIVREEAVKAFNLIEGLDFGAVDIIYNTHNNTAYVLEINTACGLAGTTLTDYTNKFRELFNV